MVRRIDVDRLKRIWKGMKSRCQTPSNTGYLYYGAKGITVCEEWQQFQHFAGWAIVNGYRDDLEIDRVDEGGHYEPGNCRWITGALNRSRRAAAVGAEFSGKLDGKTIVAAVGQASPLKLWDGHGLFLQVSKTGSASWRWKYRFEGREQLLTIGRHPAVSLAEAREFRAIAAERLGHGRNPARRSRS